MQVNRCQNYYNRPNFKGYLGSDTISKSIQKNTLLINETCFFRDIEPIEIVKNFLKELPQNKNIKILDAACSTGEETYSLAMTFKDLKNKVEITGLDLSEKCLEKAKNGIFSIYTNKQSKDLKKINSYDCFKDNFLINKTINLSPEQAHYKNLFTQNVNEISKKEAKIPFWDRFVMKTTVTCPTEAKYFKIKPELAENCKFQKGNIADLDKIDKNNDYDVIFFRNAMYHITNIISDNLMERDLKSPNELKKDLTPIIKTIHSKLNKNGLFVIGSDEIHQTQDIKGQIPEIIKSCGFKPYFTKDQTNTIIWQKI